MIVGGKADLDLLRLAGLDQVERELAAGVCGVWKPTSYSSSKDSPETVDGNRANNRAREAYCR